MDETPDLTALLKGSSSSDRRLSTGEPSSESALGLLRKVDVFIQGDYFAEGAYAKVYRCRVRDPSGREMNGILKVVEDEVDSDKERQNIVEQEIKALMAPSIRALTVVPRLLAVLSPAAEPVSRFMKLVLSDEGQTLGSWLRAFREEREWRWTSEEKKFCEDLRIVLADLVQEAVDKLHEVGWCHGDISTENVMIDGPRADLSPETDLTTCLFKIVLIDFGKSSQPAPGDDIPYSSDLSAAYEAVSHGFWDLFPELYGLGSKLP